MTPDLNLRLDAALARCREIIELSEKATKGPWKARFAPVIQGEVDYPPHVVREWRDEKDRRVTTFVTDCCLSAEDAAFIAASRDLTPALARAMIVAIEGLRPIVDEHTQVSRHNEGVINRPQGPCSCRICNALESILATLEDGKP